MPDARVNPIDPRAHSGEDAVHRAGRLAVVGALTPAFWGCGSIGHRPADALAIPAAWSGADAPTKTGNPSLVLWWLRFEDPLLSDLVAQARQCRPCAPAKGAGRRLAPRWQPRDRRFPTMTLDSAIRSQ